MAASAKVTDDEQTVVVRTRERVWKARRARATRDESDLGYAKCGTLCVYVGIIGEPHLSATLCGWCESDYHIGAWNAKGEGSEAFAVKVGGSPRQCAKPLVKRLCALQLP